MKLIPVCARQRPVAAQTIADALTLLTAVQDLATRLHGAHAGRSRFVSVQALRASVGLPAYRFDAAAEMLLTGYRLSGRFDDRPTTLEQDAAALLHQGTSRHLLTADDWRLSVPGAGLALP